MDEIIRKKLLKLKELCNKGVGGEKENAIKLYNELLLKYEIDDKEIDNEITFHKFTYRNVVEARLYAWIYFKVVGDTGYDDIRISEFERAMTGYVTQLEADEIKFLFNFYIYYLNNDIKEFIDGFCKAQKLFPETTARNYENGRKQMQNEVHDNPEKDNASVERIFSYANMMTKHTPIYEGIE